MVDLNECSPGDYLISRGGDLFSYVGKRNYNPFYQHHVSRTSDKETFAMTDEGMFFYEDESRYDIIEIVPQANSNTPYFELYEKLRLYKRASAVASLSNCTCLF